MVGCVGVGVGLGLGWMFCGEGELMIATYQTADVRKTAAKMSATAVFVFMKMPLELDQHDY